MELPDSDIYDFSQYSTAPNIDVIQGIHEWTMLIILALASISFIIWLASTRRTIRAGKRLSILRLLTAPLLTVFFYALALLHEIEPYGQLIDTALVLTLMFAAVAGLLCAVLFLLGAPLASLAVLSYLTLRATHKLASKSRPRNTP